jgi:hypothetical protein
VPIFDIIRPTLYRDRATVLPKLPVSLNDLVLPNDLTKSLYNEQMLFCDQREPSRILGFASLTALKELGMLVSLFSNNDNNIILKCFYTDK